MEIKSQRYLVLAMILSLAKNSWVNLKPQVEEMVQRMLPEALRTLLSKIGRQTASMQFSLLMPLAMAPSITTTA